jgi:hypothetical protein
MNEFVEPLAEENTPVNKVEEIAEELPEKK